MKPMRGYKSIIQEAELLAMSPEAVAEFLKRRAQQPPEDWADPVDEEAEIAVLGRSNQLIDLALARYARHIETLRPIFQRSQPGSAPRLAVLSNSTRWPEYSRFPLTLFTKREETVSWLMDAPMEEMQALFENPRINDDFLSDVLKRSNLWTALSDERLISIVAILSRNERMWTANPDDFPDGFADASYNAVFNSAWKLAENVEPTESWARVLSYLYERLEPHAFSVEDPLRFVARWRPEPSNAKVIEEEAKDNARGSLSDYQGVRKGLARLALRTNSKLISSLLASPDIGMRSAAYADGLLTPKQLLAGYQQDGELVFEQAKNNLQLWHNSECRDVLHRIAWAEDSPDWFPGLYTNLCTKIAKEHPDWFGEET